MSRSRPPFRPIVALGLVAAMLGYVGCSVETKEERAEIAAPGKAAAEAAEKAKKAAEVAEGLKNDPFYGFTPPVGAIIVTGQQLGYLEPCGCTKGQLGGLIRRSNLIDQLRNERKWPLTLLDLGGLIKDPANSRGGPEQSKVKFNTALKALATLKYDALALSAEDLKVGVDEAVSQFMNMPGDRMKIVSANVSAPGLEAKWVKSFRVKAGPVPLGVTAVTAPESIKALKDPSLDLLEVKPIDDVLPAILEGLKKEVAMRILLVQGSPELAKKLALAYPEFQLVIGVSSNPEPPTEGEWLNNNRTFFVEIGEKGKYVGVIGMLPDANLPFRYRRIALDSRFDGPGDAMKAVIQGEFRDALKAQGIVENFPRHNFVNGAEGATYLGAESCKTCHPNAFAKWRTTKHSRAFDSLLHDPKPNVIFDAECVSCHTTGFGYTGGWKSPELTSYLKGNQCENCHGPGSKHAEAPDDKSFREAMHLTSDLADRNGLCIRCHDEDNSPDHFDFSQRWLAITHTGLDTYTDPKTHQPLPAKATESPAK